jgi:hypothetical protein
MKIHEKISTPINQAFFFVEQKFLTDTVTHSEHATLDRNRPRDLCLLAQTFIDKVH